MTKILVIEDDAVNAQVLRDFLSAHGYEIETARTGLEGLKRFKENPPALAIIDVLLPQRNGFEVAFSIRHSPEGSATPLLLMSAVYTDLAHAEEYATKGIGAQGYLIKPFELPLLLERVRALVGEA